MTKRDHRELMQLAKQGDMDAFAEVFEELRPFVYTVAYRVVGPNDADDIVMDTFLKAWRALPNFNGHAAAKTWLYRITHNCALDYTRSRSRRKEDTLPETENEDRTIQEFADANQATAPDQIMHDELTGQVQTALSQLDDIHRVTLQLRYSDNFSYADIAAATNVSIGTVMSRLFNGKRKLKRIFDDMST